eukprot:1821409-Amphidinium_carterae.1
MFDRKFHEDAGSRCYPTLPGTVVGSLIARAAIASSLLMLDARSSSKERNANHNYAELLGHRRSRSLTELTRQITPPTKQHGAPRTELVAMQGCPLARLG